MERRTSVYILPRNTDIADELVSKKQFSEFVNAALSIIREHNYRTPEEFIMARSANEDLINAVKMMHSRLKEAID